MLFEQFVDATKEWWTLSRGLIMRLVIICKFRCLLRLFQFWFLLPVFQLQFCLTHIFKMSCNESGPNEANEIGHARSAFHDSSQQFTFQCTVCNAADGMDQFHGTAASLATRRGIA
jgi:hypothetical protein